MLLDKEKILWDRENMLWGKTNMLQNKEMLQDNKEMMLRQNGRMLRDKDTWRLLSYLCGKNTVYYSILLPVGNLYFKSL